MPICKCLTQKNSQCKNEASQKSKDNPLYCWAHQNCKKNIDEIVTQDLPSSLIKIPIKQKTTASPADTNLSLNLPLITPAPTKIQIKQKIAAPRAAKQSGQELTQKIQIKQKTGVSKKGETDFGIIFHWGVYSVPAYDDPKSALNRKTQNGGEWYLKRLKEKGTWSPISGWEATQKYHKETYGDMQYEDFAPLFQAENWNPDQWMELCQKVGATYVIITAKHHDGYCLWPTKTREQDLGFLPTDLIKTFAESAKKHNLKFGVYYSWGEFQVGCSQTYLNSIVAPQIHELMAYSPQIWWFDGDWFCKDKPNKQFNKQFMDKICDEIHQKLPNATINDRIGHFDERKDPNYLGRADYRVYGDRAIPKVKPLVPWEHINTIGLSWGRNRAQTANHYKTPQKLLELYSQVKSLGGRFLLNLGPNSDGTLDELEVQRLIEFSSLAGLDTLY